MAERISAAGNMGRQVAGVSAKPRFRAPGAALLSRPGHPFGIQKCVLRSCLSVALIVLCQDRTDAQLQQIGKLDLLGLGRNQKVLACHFKDATVTVLIRRSNAESRQVAFSLCEFGRSGEILSDKVIHRWDPETGGGMNFAFALLTEHFDKEANDVGTLVLGPLTRDESGVFQRYSSAGRLQWTEPLPGGSFAYCLGIKPTKQGFVLAGVGGNPSAATVWGVDWRGRELWKVAGKKRHQTNRLLVNSNGDIVAFSNPIESSSDDLSTLMVASADGKKMRERQLEEFGKISEHRVDALYLGAVDFAWLAGPMKNDTFVFAYANKPFVTGSPAELRGEVYDLALDKGDKIEFGASLAGWTYLFDVSKLDNERLLVCGVSGEKVRCAVATLDGKIADAIQIPPPEHTIAVNVWTDGVGRVAMFLECMEQTDTGAVVRAGTLYLLQDKK